MTDVVLLYSRDCPSVREARTNLLHAFRAAGTTAVWRELDVDHEDTPTEWRSFGSPTVLVDGRDVADAAPSEGPSCRIYDGGRAPSVPLLVAALRATAVESPVLAPPPPRSARLSFAALPGVALALLPKGLCPACWPAYAAVLSSLGLGFLIEDRYLLPVTIGALVLATLTLAYRARARRGYGPAALGALCGAALVVGKFGLDLPDAFAYGAVAVFAAAAIWNAWPLSRRTACSACVTPSSGSR